MVASAFKQQDSAEFKAARQNNPLKAALQDRTQWRKLIGAGLGWAIYDFMYYGCTIFQPNVLNDIFGKAESLQSNCWQNIVVTAVGLPATILAIVNLTQLGLKPLQ